MDFCIISPTAGLAQFALRSKTHMVIAPQVVKDTKYLNFYVEQGYANDFIFLDNGVYEGAFDEAAFATALYLIRPNVAVLPDVICKSAESTKTSLDFLRKYSKEFLGVHWMFIPQGETLSGWRASLKCIPHFQELGTIWIGLTRFLPTHVQPDDPTIRVKLAAEVREQYPDVKIHCMGMADGDVNELKLLAKQGIVGSIDSSAPVWRGWQGHYIESRGDWRKFGREVDFSSPHNAANLYYIEHNLEVVFDNCGIRNWAGDNEST